MFKMFKNESSMIEDLMKRLKLPDDLTFGSGEIIFSIPTKSLIEKAIDTDLRSLVSDVVLEMITDKNNTDTMQPKIKKYYRDNIQSGRYNIWNNAIYYYGMSSNYFLKTEINYDLIDGFIKKYKDFACISIKSIKEFVNKEIDTNEIERFDIPENYYLDSFFGSIFEESFDMINDFSKKINIDLDISKDYVDYDRTRKLKENLEDKIKNLPDVLSRMNNISYEIEHRNELKKYSLKGLIDFNSINCGSIFLNIEKLDPDLWVELILSQESPIILLFNYKESREASEKEYDELFDILEKENI